MIRDLQGAGRIDVSTDYLVIGGGTAGLFASVWLAEAGYRVICIESGGLHQEAEEHPLNEVVHLKSVYDGAAHGRYRCIGGTSTRWGGALIPFQKADLRDAGWPIDIEDLQPFVSRVEAEFGVTAGDYELPELSTPTHTARLAKWPPFKKRNVFNLLQGRVRTSTNLSVWLNATATDFLVVDGVLRKVEARTQGGDMVTVRATNVIIAAGAIETTRLVLLMDAQNNSVVSRLSPSLGHYFSDHLSTSVGVMRPASLPELNRHVGFRFERDGTMRNLRFELSDAEDVRSRAPASFGHIAFVSDREGGFEVLRNILRASQKHRPPSLSDVAGLIRAVPWLLRAVWLRFFRRRMLFPDAAKFYLNMVIEQEPIEENQVKLSADRRDVFGRPLAELAWVVTERDQENLARAVDAFEAMWGTIALSSNARFERRPKGDAESELARGGGIYHPTGSTRLGRSADQGVVDRDLRLFAVPNVQLLSTSVFPTGGGANPTMMLLLLAARCVAGAATSRTAVSADPGFEPMNRMTGRL